MGSKGHHDIEIEAESAEKNSTLLLSRLVEFGDWGRRNIRFDIPAGRMDYFEKYTIKTEGSSWGYIYFDNVQMFESAMQ